MTRKKKSALKIKSSRLSSNTISKIEFKENKSGRQRHKIN